MGGADERSRTGRADENFCVPSVGGKIESKQSKTSEGRGLGFTVTVGCAVAVNGGRPEAS